MSAADERSPGAAEVEAPAAAPAAPTAEVIDTNVLTIASAPLAGWVHPQIPLSELALVKKVFEWVRAFRNDPNRHLVMDAGKTILEEYASRANMPEFAHYGRQVVHHKFTTSATKWVNLTYWNNGDERVADLPEEAEALMHDLGDRKIVAAAFEADAPIVNACDSDWSHPEEAAVLRMLDIELVQILNDDERRRCRTPERDV